MNRLLSEPITNLEWTVALRWKIDNEQGVSYLTKSIIGIANTISKAKGRFSAIFISKAVNNR